MLIINELTKQCALCPSASIMILQKVIAISLEERHLVFSCHRRFAVLVILKWILDKRDGQMDRLTLKLGTLKLLLTLYFY